MSSWEALWCLLFFSIGYGLGKVFSTLDYYLKWKVKIQEKEGMPRPLARLILSLMDAFHHFQLGLLLMCLEWHEAIVAHSPIGLAVFMVGFGLLTHDAENLRTYLKYYREATGKLGEK